MTPLRLELGGFTVFREPTTIDFEGLELFAIAGPTGSGKSTLLDALTYAFYGQTARLGRTGLDVLISPGLSQMYITLDFRTARGTFRVTRTADRKPSGSVSRNTRIEQLDEGAKWRQLPESEKLKEADTKLESLIGLDYDGFTRSVLLPQGAFDEFLRGDTSKRRKLLVNLLGLDRVEQMQKEAGQRSRDAKVAADAIEERLAQDYAGATPEKRRELKGVLSELETKKLELSGRQESLADELKDLDEVKRLLEDRTKLETLLRDLKRKEPEMVTKREALKLAKRAQLIAPQIAQLETLSARVKEAEANFATLTQTLAGKEKEATSARANMEKARTGAQALPELEARLTSLAGVAPLMAQLKARGGSLSLAGEGGDATYSDETWDALRQREAQLPQLKQAEKALARAEEDVKTLAGKLESLKKEESTLAQKLEKTVQEGKGASADFDKAKKAYEQAVVEDRAGALREHLNVGDPCPVCAQEVTTLPPKAQSNVAELKAAAESAEKRRDELRETYQDLRAKVTTAQNRRQDAEAALEKAYKGVGEAQLNLAGLKKTLAATESTDGDILQAHIAEQKRGLLAALAARIHVQTGGEDPDAAQKKVQARKKELETALKTSEATFQAATSALERLQTQREERQKGLTDLKANLDEAETSLNSALKTAQFETLEAARSALLREPEMSTLEADLNAYQTQKESAERRDVELRAKLAGRSLDEAHYTALKKEGLELKGALAETQTALGRTQGELQHVEAQLEKAKSLRKQLTEYQGVYDTYRLLSLDLRGNEFQDYLLGQVQAKLARRASHIIREVTEGRYDLRLSDGDYQVRDAWTTGELRNAKTLSGGETFIASLALALALSDTIAGSHALGALFLDEGFGTLDAETLNAVAEVLENLTREGRMVGVITHVRELTERLPARLTVRKGVEGSTVGWDL